MVQLRLIVVQTVCGADFLVIKAEKYKPGGTMVGVVNHDWPVTSLGLDHNLVKRKLINCNIIV